MLIIESLLFLYVLVNFLVYLVQKWLEKQLLDEPHGKKGLYVECEWYRNPTKLKHKIARKLVQIGLPLYEEAEYVTYISIGLFGLVLIFIIFANAITTPRID